MGAILSFFLRKTDKILNDVDDMNATEWVILISEGRDDERIRAAVIRSMFLNVRS